jgi:hypothetical protein
MADPHWHPFRTYILAKKKYDHEGGSKRQGLCFCRGGHHTRYKIAMMEAVLSVDKVKCLVTEKRDEGIFSRIFYKPDVHY